MFSLYKAHCYVRKLYENTSSLHLPGPVNRMQSGNPNRFTHKQTYTAVNKPSQPSFLSFDCISILFNEFKASLPH